MPTFNYKAKDRAGNTVTGTVEESDRQSAAGAVREMGYFPMDIHPATAYSADRVAQPPLRRFLDIFWTGVGLRTIALFFRQLQVLLASGMTVSEALRSIGGRSSGRMRRIIYDTVGDVERGNPMTREMSKYPRVFGPLQLAMLRVGESGGLLEQMVDRLATYLEFELEIRRMIAKTLFYPAVSFVFIVVVPHVQALVMSGFQAFVADLWASLSVWLPWAIAALVVLKLLFQLKPVRLAWDTVKVQPPVIGTAARKVAMSRFSRAFAVLYSAGLPMSNALDASADACANLYIGEALKSAKPAIEAGQGLAVSLERLHVLSPIVADMLTVGERTGDIDSVLSKAADYMESENEVTLHKLAIGVFVAAICIAGIVVGMMAVRSYGGYFADVMKLGGQ